MTTLPQRSGTSELDDIDRRHSLLGWYALGLATLGIAVLSVAAMVAA